MLELSNYMYFVSGQHNYALIALHKALFSTKYCSYFSYLPIKTCYGYSLKAPCRDTSNKYPQHMFLWRNKKSIYLISHVI